MLVAAGPGDGPNVPRALRRCSEGQLLSHVEMAEMDTPTTIERMGALIAVGLTALILPAHTPGARYSKVTQATISTTVCKKGWTATIRPPASYTNAVKQGQLVLWHLATPSTEGLQQALTRDAIRAPHSTPTPRRRSHRREFPSRMARRPRILPTCRGGRSPRARYVHTNPESASR